MMLTLCLLLQEEVTRKVDRFGEQTKILSFNQIDAWVFQGKKGETVVAHVRSSQFDPVLELVDAKDAKIREVDDAGSESRFAAELPADGTYRVRVGAYKNSGGGLYALRLDRFAAAELALDTPATGTIDRDGRGHHRFEAKAGDLISVHLTSATVGRWEILDPKGQPVNGPLEADGVHYLRVQGPAGNAYRIAVTKARIRDLGDEARKSQVGETVTDAWDFAGEPGQIVRLDVERSGPLGVDVTFVPDQKAEPEGVIPQAGALDEVRTLARYEKGARTTAAWLLGRKGKYRILVQARTGIAVDYEVRLSRPSAKIAAGGEQRGALALGEFALFELALKAGQVVSVDLTAEGFDCGLQLFDARGHVRQTNDDRGQELSSRATLQSRESSSFWILAYANAHAGSGTYVLSVREQPVRELNVGARNEGELQAGGVEIWSLAARKDQMLVISATSRAFDTVVQVFDARGVELARDDDAGTETNSLAAVRVLEDGAVTVWVSSKTGFGAYALRVMEGE